MSDNVGYTTKQAKNRRIPARDAAFLSAIFDFTNETVTGR